MVDFKYTKDLPFSHSSQRSQAYKIDTFVDTVFYIMTVLYCYSDVLLVSVSLLSAVLLEIQLRKIEKRTFGRAFK